MVKKKNEEEVENKEIFDGPVPGTVYIENLLKMSIDITLRDGRSISAGPVGGHNKSEFVPRKLLPPYVFRMAQRGEIRIMDAVG